MGAAPPEAFDPALAWSERAWRPLWLVYTPLLTYRHAEGDEGRELIPGLATDLPEVSDDGRTYELTLREGLEYSDGTEVEEDDFEHSIGRALTLSDRTGRRYLRIAGAAEYVSAGDPGRDIRGIEADEETGEVTIALTEPDPAFPRALALPPAGLVPGDTPFRDMTARPPPGVGPYELGERRPGDSFVLVRSERFEALDIPDIPTGNLIRLTARRAAEDGQSGGALPERIEPESAIVHPVYGNDYSSWELKERE